MTNPSFLKIAKGIDDDDVKTEDDEEEAPVAAII